MTITDPTSTNSLGEVEAEPQQTDNGPKEGDAEVDQESVQLPSGGEHEGAGLAAAVLAAAMKHRGTIESPPGSNRTPFGAAYGWNGVAWCNIFVSRMGFEVAGDYDLLGKFAGTIACAAVVAEAGPVRHRAPARRHGVLRLEGRPEHRGDRPHRAGHRDRSATAGCGRSRATPRSRARATACGCTTGRPPSSSATATRATPAGAAKARRPRPRPNATLAPQAAKGVAVPAFPGLMVRGKTGAGVRALQQRLKERGWKITVDGEFGPQTDRIVRAFQKDKGLTVDGEVGPRRRGAPCGPPPIT